MAEDAIKIPVELDADTEKLSSKIKSSISSSLTIGVEQAINSVLPRALDIFKKTTGAFGGKSGPGEFASYLLTQGRYAPSNAVSLSMRNAYDMLSNSGLDMRSPEMMEIKAKINASAHQASDAIRQARVAGRYDNFIDLYNTAVRTAETARTPDERKAALSLAASYRQSLANQSYVTSGLITPGEAVSNRMAASAIRRDINAKPEEDAVHQEQLAWEAEQRRLKAIEVSNTWNSLLGEQERYEAANLAQKTAEDARNEKIRAEQLAWETGQRRIKETDVSNLWFGMLSEKERNTQQILAWQEEERRAKETEDIRNNQIRAQQTAWETEQRLAKEVEMSNLWNSLLGGQERQALAGQAWRDRNKYSIISAVSSLTNRGTGDRERFAAFYAQQDKEAKERAKERTASDKLYQQQQALAIKAAVDRLTDDGTGDRDRIRAFYQQQEKTAKVFKALSESAADLTKVFVQGARAVTDVVVSEWGITGDMMDPLRTRRATRQQQAQKYGQMASGIGVGLLASGNPYLMVAGGALTIGGEAANFLGARNQARREAAEKYTGTVLDYNKRKLLYGNVNYASAQAAQLAGYTSAETVMNLDSTGSMLRGAMAFGAVGEQQMMALSMMPNYWRALMDPNASTTERLEAYAQDMNSLPADYQMYINSILPGGDESLRAYTKSASYGMMKQGYETDRTIDAFYDKDVLSYEYANTRLAKKSRREHFENIYEGSPTMLKQQLGAGEEEITDWQEKARRNLENDPLFGPLIRRMHGEENRPINVTVQLNGEVVAQNSYAQKNQEEAMTYI